MKKIKAICDYIVKQWPDADCDFYKMSISIQILREMMGLDWANQALFPNQHPVTSKVFQKAITFLKTDNNGYQFQERVSKLAIRLYNCRDVKGLQKVIDEIKSGDIYGGYAELEAGDFFYRRGIPFKFIIPTGEKMKDYDIKIINDNIINCEVKHKIESTRASKKVLETTLSSANKQVPKNQLAMFFIKIPENWIDEKEIKIIIDRVSGTFFSRNNNVIGFILHWEEMDKIIDGKFEWKYFYIKNEKCFENITILSDKIESLVDPTDNFVYIMKKYIEKCKYY